MSSNSYVLCLSQSMKPFMEGRLIKDFHYIEVEDNADAEDKIHYYLKNFEKILKLLRMQIIISNI